jgi:hypothetical protein
MVGEGGGGTPGGGKGGVDGPEGNGPGLHVGSADVAGAAGGMVAPHCRQNRIPSAAGVPQWGQTATARESICVI